MGEMASKAPLLEGFAGYQLVGAWVRGYLITPRDIPIYNGLLLIRKAGFVLHVFFLAIG